jgi:hypothetical protein
LGENPMEITDVMEERINIAFVIGITIFIISFLFWMIFSL